MNHLPPPSEADVQATGLALLRARGCTVYRNNNRVLRVPGKGGKDRLMTAGLGINSADAVGLLPGGRFLAVEFKRPGERPSVNQLMWLEAVNAAGGLALWVDDPATLEALFVNLAFCGARGGRLAVRFGERARVVFVMQEEVDAP